MKITPARRATKRKPGRAAIAADGTVGITVRAPGPEVLYPRARTHVVTGPADIWAHSANGAHPGDHVVACKKTGRLASRGRGQRGRKGWLTVPGAFWRRAVGNDATIGLIHIAGSGPHGGRPR